MTARTDSDRIDWLQSKGCIELELYGLPHRDRWCVEQGDETLGDGASLRAAIDAAMDAEPSQARATEADR